MHEKQLITARTGWLCQMFCLPVRIMMECVTKSFGSSYEISVWYEISSDVLTLKYKLLLLRPQTPVFRRQKKCDLCLYGGRRVTPMWKTLRLENKCKLMRCPLKHVMCHVKEQKCHVRELAVSMCHRAEPPLLYSHCLRLTFVSRIRDNYLYWERLFHFTHCQSGGIVVVISHCS